MIGRFAGLRRAYSWTQARLGRDLGAAVLTLAASIPAESLEACCRDLRRQCVAAGPHLTSAIVDEIHAFALTAPCRRPRGTVRFCYGDVRNGLLADGTAVPVADIDDPEVCPAIAALRRDPALIALAHRYLGYEPRHADLRLFWSFAGDLSDPARRNGGQTIDFHYDVPWYNAVYVYFYLTDTDLRSGAHVVLPGSAADKPLAFILSRCMRDDASLAAYYGALQPLAVEGAAGFCFFEDPYCYHKALVPISHDRLMLQIRFR
jgi:hypothetical protein